MARPDIVSYFKANLKQFPADDLRAQLYKEGVSEADVDAALAEALKPEPPAPTKVKARASGMLARLLMLLGMGAIIAAAVMALMQKPAGAPGTDAGGAAATSAAVGATGESGFVGHYGYVVKLPPGYAAVQTFKDDRKTIEIVHFCKAGTDPTDFLDEGLFGQLGIVKLRVEPSPISDDLHGLENLSSLVQARATQRGEKFTAKNLQISTMRGVQMTYEAPSPRVEAYLLGRTVLYSFMAGQDDDVYRGLLQSLRDSRSEM